MACEQEETASKTSDGQADAGNVAQASAGAQEASERAAQAASVSKSMAQDVAGVDAAAGDIRSGGEQVQAGAAELSELADQLKSLVGEFKIDGDREGASVLRDRLPATSRATPLLSWSERSPVRVSLRPSAGRWPVDDAGRGSRSAKRAF